MAASRQRNLVILAIITAVVIIAAAVTSISRAPQSSKEKTLLFPSLQDRLNDTREVIITGEGRSVNLIKEDGGWVVEQAGGYPATFEKIRNLLVNMASVRVIAEKTGNPDLYPRLGVEDPQGKGAASHLVELRNGAGETMASLIVGKERKSSSPLDTPAVYVRPPDEEQSLLVEGRLPVSSQLTDWFEQQLFSVKPSRVQSVTIRHPGEETVTVSRPEGGDDFTVEPVPEGRKPQSEVILTRVGTVLENTFANNVASAAEFSFPENHVVTTVRTFDGLVARITSATRDNRNYVAYEFEVDASRLPEQGSEDAADSGGGEDTPDIRAEVEEFNNIASGWVFTVPDYRYETLIQDIDDLTRPE